MENVVEIQTLWTEFTGFNAAAAAAGADNTNPWDLQKVMKDLRRAQELDPTDLLFLMLLEEYLDDRLGDTKVSAFQYLADPSDFDRSLDYARRLRGLLEASGMYEAREELRGNVMRALDHYGAGDRKEVTDLLAKRASVTFLWRDALDAMDKSLSTHQFLQGEPEERGYKPLYQSQVLGFWSINDALRLVANMPSGVSMCLIRDRDAIHSHFAFVVRNGGNLSVVTDIPNWTHPLQKKMSRRPERSLDERMGRSRFPYELLNIEYLVDEEGEVVGLNVPRQEGLVPHQTRAFKIKPIRDIAADEVVWTAIMFALLTKKFFADNWKAAELSYTGEMVDVPQVLEIAATHAGLPVPVDTYKPIVAEPLRSVELTPERMRTEGKVRTDGVHDWMEVRYGPKVPDALLNLSASPNGQTLMLTKSGETRFVAPKTAENFRRSFMADQDLHAELQEFDATTFGSAERIMADRVFIARLNQAKEVGRLAEAEFKERKDDVLRWWKSTVDKSRDRLLDAIRIGSFPVWTDLQSVSFNRNFTHLKPGEREVLTRHPFTTQTDRFRLYDYHATVLGDRDYSVRGSKPRCVLSGRPATDLCVFKIETAHDLAAVAGVAISELPDVLQHWSRSDRHGGNQILDRIDPMDWAVRNPWSSLNFQLVIFISRYAFPAPAELERIKHSWAPDNAGKS